MIKPMKLVLTDKTYDGDVKHEVENDHMGSDLALVFEYLENYKKTLEEQVEYTAPIFGVRIVWEAKVNKIKNLMEKYKELIDFIRYIDSEENAL